MQQLTAGEVAAGYRDLASVRPPVGPIPDLVFNDLPLVFSVHPRQHELLRALAQHYGSGSGWEDLQQRVWAQRSLREHLFEWISDLDQTYRDAPDDFEFPDPYSLLLWIWTFHLFNDSYTIGPTNSWGKYLYRGESADYGETRFTPKAARPGADPRTLASDIPRRLKALLRSSCAETLQHVRSAEPDSLLAFELATMSGAQAIAVAQHYGYPTPLLDVTGHPEVALFFATNPKAVSSESVGFVGYCKFEEPMGREQASRIAIVNAPPIFSRIHCQTGYFICQPRNPDRQGQLLICLKFRHRPEHEPMFPLWIQTVGYVKPTEQQPERILAEPFHLEDRLRGPLPAPDLDSYEIDEAIVRAFSSPSDVREVLSPFLIAAAQSGCTSDGRRFAVVNPILADSLISHAPMHSLVAVARLVADPSPELRPLARYLLQLLRIKLIAAGIGADHGRELGVDGVMSLIRRMIVSSGDVIRWPLSEWYTHDVAA
jgi:hypothetical protein